MHLFCNFYKHIKPNWLNITNIAYCIGKSNDLGDIQAKNKALQNLLQGF